MKTIVFNLITIKNNNYVVLTCMCSDPSEAEKYKRKRKRSNVTSLNNAIINNIINYSRLYFNFGFTQSNKYQDSEKKQKMYSLPSVLEVAVMNDIMYKFQSVG